MKITRLNAVADIIPSFGFGLIPFVVAYIGAIISWIAGVFFTVSLAHSYLALRKTPETALLTQPIPQPAQPYNLKPPKEAARS